MLTLFGLWLEQRVKRRECLRRHRLSMRAARRECGELLNGCRKYLMRLALCSSLFLGFLAAHLNASSIDVLASATGPDSFHYSFTLNGFDLLQDQAVDLKFDSSVYLSLSNASAPANFSTTVLQPGNPPGAPGDYLLEALISNLALPPGSVGIDVTLTGLGEPGPLPFSVDQFDAQGHFVGVIPTGMTSDPTSDPVTPEPASVWLTGLGLLAVGILRSRWRPYSQNTNAARQ